MRLPLVSKAMPETVLGWGSSLSFWLVLRQKKTG